MVEYYKQAINKKMSTFSPEPEREEDEDTQDEYAFSAALLDEAAAPKDLPNDVYVAQDFKSIETICRKISPILPVSLVFLF